jgi:Domain of unknown function (DUF4337)
MNNLEQKHPEEQVLVSVASERAEAYAGVLIAFFAAMMAISDLVNSNVEEEKNKAESKQNSYFSWYQSKSVKQSLQENELSTLEMLIKAGLVKAEKEAVVKEDIDKIKDNIKRYKKEKKEIMEGSSTLPESEWVQDLDGQMGKIVGVNQWEKIADKLDNATNKFDISMLFFQISLVLGAVCVVIYDNPKIQKMMIYLMVISGIAGIIFAAYGYHLSFG